MKTRKPLYLLLIISIVAMAMFFAVSCGGNGNSESYTLTFETYGGTEIDPITAPGGGLIFAPQDPQKTGYVFVGWYSNSRFDGEPVELPNIMPNKNTKYYAKFDPIESTYTVTYAYNLGKVSHANDIGSQTVEAGESVTVADGNLYMPAEGYKFLGWTDKQVGVVSLDGSKNDGQYDPGDTLTVNANITLYAQWAYECTDMRNESDDLIYVYQPVVKPIWAILVRSGKPDLLGEVVSGNETESGYYEFSFKSDEFDGGECVGRIYGYDRKYATPDGAQGEYMPYDYALDVYESDSWIVLDGYGYAEYHQQVGDLDMLRASGAYGYDIASDDYIFQFTDEFGDASTARFKLNSATVTGSGDREYIGYCRMRGAEYGTFYYYDYNNKNYNNANYISFDGYGNAIFKLPGISTPYTGTYKGSDDYVDYYGEWEFVSDSGAQSFKYILSAVSTSFGVIYVYAKYDDTYLGEYTNGTETLSIDGYGNAEYITNRARISGDITIVGDVVTFEPYTISDQGAVTEFGRAQLTLNVENKTFSIISDDGNYVVSGNSLTGYTGTSPFVVIPNGVTSIAANAFAPVGVTPAPLTVTIPVSVSSIGALAFSNNSNIRRAVFLSQTPISINFASADPFGTCADDFAIVVPQTALAAYVSAWSSCPYVIKGSEDAAEIAAFEIANGVLMCYNKPADAVTPLDIAIPDEVTEIADGVFMGLDYIRSVSLNNVKTIGNYAFSGCSELVTVWFDKVEYIGIMAFADCVKLNNSNFETADVIELPAIEVVDYGAFSGCIGLRTVKLGDGIEYIGGMAFYQCNIYEADAPLTVELLGDTAPELGANIANGNVDFRFKVQNIDVVKACYDNVDYWANYVTYLYLESGEEKGDYISTDGYYTLTLDGRAILQDYYLYMYEIDIENGTIVLYDYDTSTGEYTRIVGTYVDEVINITISGTMIRFNRVKD